MDRDASRSHAHAPAAALNQRHRAARYLDLADAPLAPQLALLSLTFFAIAAGLDCCWALLARTRPRRACDAWPAAQPSVRRLPDRRGIGLALAHWE
jgi:hypothetical protein